MPGRIGVRSPSVSWPRTVAKHPVDVLVVDAAARAGCSSDVVMHGEAQRMHAVNGAELATCSRELRKMSARLPLARAVQGLDARWLQERTIVVD